MEEAAVEVEGLTFGYEPGQPVLRSLDWRVPAGSFCALLGPNGAGKSSLLGVLCGALVPAAGRVRVFGRELGEWDRRELARAVAVVPQRFELAFPFRVEELVLLGRLPHRPPLALDRPEDLAAAREAMHATGVLPLAGRRALELSGGELQRVLVAKALAQQPRLLLLDEPASHLDIRHQVELFELIERVRREAGVTVVAAVHDLNLAAAACDHFSLLKHGALVAAGGLEEVMTYRRLREVFGIDIYVGVNELTGQRLFTPMMPAGRSTRP